MILLLLASSASAWLAPHPTRGLPRFFSVREQAEARQRERAASKVAEEAANKRQRLEFEYAAYKKTSQYNNETLEAFAERRERVGSAAKRNGWIAFALVALLNLKLVLAPADLKAVAQDPNGLCVAARGDRLRGDQLRGLNSKGEPCMTLSDFARRLILE